MILYPRKALPGNMKLHVARLRSGKERRTRLPKWLDDDRVRERILRVYAMYIARHSLPEIMGAESISVPQIYKDLGRAREMRNLLFQKDIEHMLMEQVEAHRAIISEARVALADVRKGTTTKIPRTPTTDDVTDENAEPETEMSISEATPARARAEADLLRVVAENEKMIEELLGLRDKERQQLGDLPSEPGARGVTIIVDARTQTIKVEDKQSTELKDSG